jgi:hypothetical protein
MRIIAAVVLLSCCAVGQYKAPVAAPIPAPILTGRRVFVANAGWEEPFYEEPFFSGGPDRAYNQFYAAAKAWGHYETVTSPADADVVFEIGFSVPPIDVKGVRGEPVLMAIPYDPQFRLVIRDAKTNALLWAFAEHAEWAITKGNRDKNFDKAITKLLEDVRRVCAPESIPGK